MIEFERADQEDFIQTGSSDRLIATTGVLKATALLPEGIEIPGAG